LLNILSIELRLFEFSFTSDFVRKAFQLFNKGQVLAILNSGDSSLDLIEKYQPKTDGGWIDMEQSPIESKRPALISFTSGTEGPSKAIVISHSALADTVFRLNKVMEVDESIREYIGIPVTYSFGFGRCRAVAAARGKAYIPENGFNPLEIVQMLKDDKINAISAVPTLWRTLLSNPELIGDLGSKIKWIEIGSQFMSQLEKEQMKQMFPKAVIVQHYGLTEASRTTFLRIDKEKGANLNSIGYATDQVDIKISDRGRIMVSGPHVALGQLVNGKIKKLTDQNEWLETSDFGEIKNNLLYYGGRADDLINCGGLKVNPDSIQESVNKALKVENQIGISKISNQLLGDGFFVAVEESSGLNLSDVKFYVAKELEKQHSNLSSAITCQFIKRIPRTATGKIQRKELSQLYQPQKSEVNENSNNLSSIERIFSNVFVNGSISPTSSFRTLGGDSLNFVQLMIDLEKELGQLPDNWDQLTIAQLQKLTPNKTRRLTSWVDSSILLRTIAILAVVATHAGGSVLGGGTLLLFSLIGYNLARFKINAFAENNIWPWLVSYIAIILIPYYLVLILNQFRLGTFEPDMFFLFSNLVDRKITTVFPFWFVQSLVQCMAIFSIMFSFKTVKNAMKKNEFATSLIIMTVLFLVRFTYPLIWQTDYVNNLVPVRFLAIIWLGWMFQIAKDKNQQAIVLLAGLTFTFFDTGLAIKSIWLGAGCLLLTYIKKIPAPKLLVKPINDIGAATFYIFSVNGIIIMFFNKLVTEPPIWLVFLFTMACSMLIWFIFERFGLISNLKGVISSNLLKLKGNYSV